MRLTSHVALLMSAGALLAAAVGTRHKSTSRQSECWRPDAVTSVDSAAAATTCTVNADSENLSLDQSSGTVWYRDGKWTVRRRFTGFTVKYYGNGQIAERVQYQDGKREGVTERWYPNGMLSFSGVYRENRRDGISESYWDTGKLRSQSNFVDGVADGVQRQWYRSGAIFKELNLENGREAGLQRAWRENGKLYANYEAKDGRVYGLKRANLCYGLDDEELVVGWDADAGDGN